MYAPTAVSMVQATLTAHLLSLTDTKSIQKGWKGITHTVRPKNTKTQDVEKLEHNPSAPLLSLKDAIEIYSLLSGKGLLCSKCGVTWAEHVNQYHQHCESCKNPNASYNQQMRGSSFERLLCNRFRDWCEANFCLNGPSN